MFISVPKRIQMYIFICNLTKTYKYIHLRMRTRTDTPRILRRPEEILEYFSALTCHTFFHMLNAQTFAKYNREFNKGFKLRVVT